MGVEGLKRLGNVRVLLPPYAPGRKQGPPYAPEAGARTLVTEPSGTDRPPIVSIGVAAADIESEDDSVFGSSP
ncbi:hypothetical protein GCM10008179_09850 [Hansschlegelia plantiphila]|uniref:Uncharacterized protein n=1 Tax=Hansschlegelia plantiphila TaxID=374655 RepID=A0A9W6MUW2_9HYPH|nr:hypothetical protein GCM10008179_09850 [Hansschlegelia plantiphila]